jgi:hypothetical protein
VSVQIRNRSVFSSQVIVVSAYQPGHLQDRGLGERAGCSNAGDRLIIIKLANHTNLVFLTGARITDFLPPHTVYKPASASPPLSSGPDPLAWNLGTNVAGVPGVVSVMFTNSFATTGNTFDTYIDAGRKGKNFGGTGNLLVSGDANHANRTLVRFDLSSIPTNATISSATLTLTKTGGYPAQKYFGYRLTNAGRRTL